MPELGGGQSGPPIFVRSAQPGRTDYHHPLILAPPIFFTFRHHCKTACKMLCKRQLKNSTETQNTSKTKNIFLRLKILKPENTSMA